MHSPVPAGCISEIGLMLPARMDERMEGSMRCGCHLSLVARMAYLTYVGGHEAKRAPQIAIAPCARPIRLIP